MNIQINAVDFEADSKLKDLIIKKVTKLEQYFDKIIDIEVFLRLENQSAQVKDKSIHIKVNIPGDMLFSRESSELFEKSLDLAVESLRRQLKKYKEKIRN